MRHLLYIPTLLFAVTACAPTKPSQPAVLDESEYYVADGVERPSQSWPGQARLVPKKLLPDPHGGLGTTNDLTLKVTDIRLTNQYTILFLTFGENSQGNNSYLSRNNSSISFNADGRLVAGSDSTSLKTYKFIKAEGIVLAPNSQKVQADEQVKFRLYFERLDKGTEDFNLFECEDNETTTCWNVRGMHVANPADSATVPNRK